ncbi:sensor histidine kinase [Halobaculum sp. MBLA0147]|uniref:sensor histidine kinase n=1 Tax=Halobaculum sp. MBLA0147 TaxID=3079934 RepID=UPI003524317C
MSDRNYSPVGRGGSPGRPVLGEHSADSGRRLAASGAVDRDHDEEGAGNDGESSGDASGDDATGSADEERDRAVATAAGMAHDLRNSLNVLSGSLDDLAADEDADSATVDRCRTAVDRMETLIDDHLTLARVGEAAVETERVSVRAAAATAWETVRTDRARLVVETDAVVVADESRLVGLFENLFRNAVEHGTETGAARSTTEEASSDGDAGDRETGASERDEDEVSSVDPSVTVTVRWVDGGLAVDDDGPGVPEELRATVFEPGYTTARDGTGLGLAIVATVADAHGWVVRVADSPTGGARVVCDGVERVDG